jgi:hypothetical protein
MLYLKFFESDHQQYLFRFPSSCLGTNFPAKPCFAKNPNISMTITFLQAELGAQVRPQAGAWRRDEITPASNYEI